MSEVSISIVYVPSLWGWTTPDWYPRWVEWLFLRTHDAAPWVILAALIVVTIASLTVPENRTTHTEERQRTTVT